LGALSDVARTDGGPPSAMTGSRGTSVSSSIHTVPAPPLPAVIANSIAAASFSSPPPSGPQAKVMCRFFRTTSVHSGSNTKSRRLTHQTLSPVRSTNLISRLFERASPRMRNVTS
jgi:hypothetical protein